MDRGTVTAVPGVTEESVTTERSTAPPRDTQDVPSTHRLQSEALLCCAATSGWYRRRAQAFRSSGAPSSLRSPGLHGASHRSSPRGSVCAHGCVCDSCLPAPHRHLSWPLGVEDSGWLPVGPHRIPEPPLRLVAPCSLLRWILCCCFISSGCFLSYQWLGGWGVKPCLRYTHMRRFTSRFCHDLMQCSAQCAACPFGPKASAPHQPSA